MAYTIKAEITPTEIRPFMEKYPPKAAMITKPMLPIQFMMGPMIPLKISVLMPVWVSSSEVRQKLSVVRVSC